MDQTNPGQQSPHKDKSLLKQLEDFLQLHLVTKAPYTLSPKVKEFIVKFTPWAAVIVFVLTLPLVLGALGLGLLYSPFLLLGGMHGYSTNILSLLLFAVTIVLELMAIPGLFKRQMGAWNLMYYAVLIRTIADLLQFQVVSALLAVVSLYLLFQVRSYYK